MIEFAQGNIFQKMVHVALRVRKDKDSQVLPREYSMKPPAFLNPVTREGLLYILHAPTDGNDTLTTVTNLFEHISNHKDQKHIIITANQALQSRSKELMWANPEFETVIFLIRGLLICFSILKDISQYRESAGLNGLWTEAGLHSS